MTVGLADLNDEERALLADVLDDVSTDNAIDIACLLLDERSAVDLEYVGHGDGPETARKDAADSSLNELLETLDLPYCAYDIPQPGDNHAVDYYVAHDEDAVESFAEYESVTDISQRDMGDYFDYPEDAIDAFVEDDQATLLDNDLTDLRDEGQLTDDEARDTAVLLPYVPPKDGLDDHVAAAAERRERLLEAADTHDLPELRAAVEDAREGAFNPFSDFPLPARAAIIVVGLLGLFVRGVISLFRRAREAVSR